MSRAIANDADSNAERWASGAAESGSGADAVSRRLHAVVRRVVRAGYGLISYRLLNGLSNGTRRTRLKPASAQSSRTLGSWKPNVPSPMPPRASEVVMQ